MGGDDDGVGELTPGALLEVAGRLDVAGSFEDLVYRESEVDALWTLVDLEARRAERDGAVGEARRWARIRERLWAVHDLIPDGRGPEAAARLRALAAELADPAQLRSADR